MTQRTAAGRKIPHSRVFEVETVFLCFSSDFLLPDANKWRDECWDIIKERQDLNFLFLTKRIENFINCIPSDWNNGYDNVIVGCTVENQINVDYKLGVFDKLPKF